MITINFALFLCQTAAASDSASFCKIRPKAMYLRVSHTLTGMKTKYDGNNLACLVHVLVAGLASELYLSVRVLATIRRSSVKPTLNRSKCR